MRKYLEKDMLADSLQGRIRFNCTTYVGMDGDHIFEVFVDNTLAKQFSMETVNSYFISEKELKPPIDITEYWSGFCETYSNTPIEEREEYTDGEFCDALNTYRNQSIGDSLCSDNPIERMFAILDRRIGKRKLISIKNTVNQQPKWLSVFYRLRLEAEGIQ